MLSKRERDERRAAFAVCTWLPRRVHLLPHATLVDMQQQVAVMQRADCTFGQNGALLHRSLCRLARGDAACRQVCAQLASAATAALLVHDPLPACAHEVVCSNDLLQAVLGHLRLCDHGAAGVCRQWRDAWRGICAPQPPLFHVRLRQCGLGSEKTPVGTLFATLARREAELATWNQEYANAIRPLRERALQMLNCHKDGLPSLLGQAVLHVALDAWQWPTSSNLHRLPQGLREYVQKLREWAEKKIGATARGQAGSEENGSHEWLRVSANRRGPEWYKPLRADWHYTDQRWIISDPSIGQMWPPWRSLPGEWL